MAVALLHILADCLPNDAAVHLVFSSKVLRDQDMFLFKNLLPTERVHLHTDLRFDVNDGDFVILDEGDEWIFTDIASFRALSKKAKAVIVLTASVSETSDGYEAYVLK